MFCQECGQLIEERIEQHQDGMDTVEWRHVNPNNDDHKAVFDPGNIPPTREQMDIS